MPENILQGILDDHIKSVDTMLPEMQSRQEEPLPSYSSEYPIARGASSAPKVSGKEEASSIFQGIVDDTKESSTRTNVNRNSSVTAAQIPKSARDRYTVYQPGLSQETNEDIAAANQTGMQVIGAGIKNGLIGFSKNFVQGVTEPIAGTIAMLKDAPEKGVFNKSFYDNAWNKQFEAWDTYKTPIYESTARKNAPWYSTKTWLTSNALASALETIGDIGGIAATVWATGGAAEALGAGRIGEAMGARYVNAVGKLQELQAVMPEGVEGTKLVEELTQQMNSIKAAGGTNAAKLDQVTQSIDQLSKKYVSNLTNYNKFRQAAVGTIGNLGIASGSALQTSSHFRQKMVDDIRTKENREPSPEEMTKIDEMSGDVGAWTGALMTVLGAVTLHGTFKGLLAKGDGEALVREEIGAFEQTGEKEVAGIGKVPEYGRPAAKVYEGNKVSQIGSRAWDITKKAPGWIQKRVDVWPAIGMLEFGLVSPSVEGYYDKKYKEGDASIINDALVPNLKGIFTKEGAGSFFLGLIGGMPFEAVRKFKEHGKLDANTTSAISSLNSTYLKSNLKAQIDSIKRGKQLRAEYIEAIRNGDKEAEMTLKDQQLENYLYPRIKYGQKALVDKDIAGLRKLTETADGIQQLQADGVIPTDGNLLEEKEKFLKRLDDTQRHADSADNYYKALTLKYAGYVGPNGKRVFDDEHIEKLMFLSTGVDGINERIRSLAENIRKSKLSDNPEFQKKFSELVGKLQEIQTVQRAEGIIGKAPKELINEIYSDIGKLQVTIDEKDNVSKQFTDYLKLHMKKKMYLDEYEDIVTKPQDHGNVVQENLVNTPVDETGEDKIPGNYVLGVKTKNRDKVDMKIGEVYVAGEKIVPGKYGDDRLTRFRDFSEFTIVGERIEGPTGKRLITIRTEDGSEQDIPESVFAKYKIGKLADIRKNRNANYWYNNRNSVYEYKLPGGKKVEGRLNYDSESDEFHFVYTDENGKKRETMITKDQFRDQDVKNEKGEVVSKRDARLKKIGEITKADEEFLKAKETEKEQAQRQKLVEGKLEVINKLIEDKKKSIKEIEDEMLDHEIKVEKTRNDIKELQEKLEKYPQRENKGNLTKDTKRYLGTTIDGIREMHKVIADSENRIKELQTAADDLQGEIDYLNAIEPEELPNGRALLRMMKENKSALENVILDIGQKINTLSKFIDSTKQLLSNGLKRFSDFLNTFRHVYPEVAVNSDSIEKFSRDLDENMDNAKFLVGDNNSYVQDMADMKKAISAMNELEIPIKEKALQDAQDDIQQLYDQLSQIGKELKVKKELYEAFQKKLKEYTKAEAKRRLFEGEYKKNLSGRQHQLNIRLDGSAGINTPEEWQKNAGEEWEDPKKNVYTVYASSIAPSQITNHESEFYKANNYWSRRYNNFLKNINLLHEGKEGYVADKGNLKVITVTRNNQVKYFGEKEFIPESYQDYNDNTQQVSNIDAQRGAIALVLVYDTEDGMRLVDQEGKLLGNLNETTGHDPSQFVYTYLENAIPERTGEWKGTKYFAPEGTTEEQEKEIARQAVEARKKVIDSPEKSKLYTFTQSRGIPNVAKDADGKIIRQNNSVTSVNLIPHDSIKGSILIPDVAYVDGEKQKTQILATGDKNVKMPIGYPLLEHGTNLVFLNSRKLNEKDGKHLYNVIKAMADDFIANNGKLSYTYTDYLSSVLYWKDPQDDKAQAARNQIWLDNEGNLVMGVNRVKVKFTPDDIAAGELDITTFLENSYHQVGKKALKEDSFTEITGIDDKGQPITRNWKSYEHYLLSETYDLTDAEHPDNGKKREGILPLTVDIKKPENEYDTPLLNKYITIHDLADYHDVAPKVEEKKEPEKAPETTTAQPVADSSKKIQFKAQGKKQNPVADGVTENIYKVSDQYQYKYTIGFDKEGEPVVKVEEDAPKSIQGIIEVSSKTIPLEERKKLATEGVKEPVKVEEKKVEIPAQEIPKDVDKKAVIDERAAKRAMAAEVGDPNSAEAVGTINFREYVPEERYDRYENIEEFRQFMKDTLPQIKWEDLPDMIKTGRGSYAWGVYHDHYLAVYQNAPYGTGYHEAFHAVWDSFLSDKEQLNLYKEFRSRTGEFQDRVSRKMIDFSKATDKEIREALAEELREFKMGNPEYTKPSVITTFFKKLMNFIKHFVLRRPETIQGVFDKMNSSYYRNSKFIKRESQGPEYSEMKDLSVADKNTILHGLSWRMIQNLKQKTGDMVRMAEGDITPTKLFQELYSSLEDMYENPQSQGGVYQREKMLLSKATDDIQKSAIQADTDKALDLWDYIKNNKEAVSKDLSEFFRKHRVILTSDKVTRLEKLADAEVTQQDMENDIIKVEFAEDNQDRGYDRDILRIDAKQNAPVEIKILYSFLTQTEGPNPNADKGLSEDLTYPAEKINDLMLPKLVDTPKYIYQTLDAMAGITDLTTMQKDMKQLAKKEPILVRIYNNIFRPNPTLEGWKLQLKFQKFAGKQKPDYVAWRVAEDGTSYIMNSNLATDSKRVVQDWESDIKKNTNIVSYNKGSYTIDARKIKNNPVDEKSTAAFLKELQLPVSDDIMKKLSKGEKAGIISEAAKLKSLLSSGGVHVKAIGKSLNINGPLGKIAEYIVKAEGIYNPASHINIEGNSVQNHILHNSTSRMMSAINSASTLENLLKRQPRLAKDIFSRNSRWLVKGGPLFDDAGQLREDLTTAINEGLLNDMDTRNPKVPIDKMNRAMRHMSMLNMNIGRRGRGMFYSHIPADSSTEWGMWMNHYITTGQYKDGSYKNISENILMGYLEDEVNVIKENIAGTRKLTDAAMKADAYKKLQTFKDILQPDTVKLVEDYAQSTDNQLDTKAFLKTLKSKITGDIWKYVDDGIAKEREFLGQYRILEENVKYDPDKKEKTYNFHGLTSDFRETMDMQKRSVNGEPVYTDEQINDILRFRRLNLMMHNTELKKVFYGPFYEISDDTKRNKLFQSGTELTYTGNEFNKWASEKLNSPDGNQLVPGDIGYHQFTDTLPVFTYDHDKGVVSRYVDQIRGVIGDKAKPYIKTEESDAQGIMLDTHWREYSLKSGAAWTSDNERQHQYDTAMARLADNERKGGKKYTDSKLKLHDEALKDKGNPNIVGTGTVQKPMGAGLLESDTQAIPFAIKTSIFRLTYPLAKDRGLEDLYWWMHDNKIGLVGPKSFQKFGRNPELPNLYNDEGKFNLTSLSKEQVQQKKISVNYGDFNKIVETAKSKTGKTMGSQLRSLAILNSFDNGLPVDYYKKGDNYSEKWAAWNKLTETEKEATSERYRMFKANDRSIGEIGRRGYEDSMNKLGITEKDGQYHFSDPEKVVKYLRDEITKRDLPSNIADGLNWVIDSSTGEEKLQYPLESLPNYTELKSMLWSVVDKNIIRPKLNGGDYTLVASTLWEDKSKGRETITVNGKKALASSELKFYQRGEIDSATGKRNKTSKMQVMIGNPMRNQLAKWAEKTGKVALTDEELLTYLNKTAEGKKLLRGIGFRIPTQGLNSVDAFEIHSFLPPDMGDAVVVPSEIVTKVGSDFDIDKLGVYHYNFDIDSEGYPHIVPFLDDSNSTDTERYIKYVNEHNKNKGDVKALKESSEYQDMEAANDAVYGEAKEEVANYYDQYKGNKEKIKGALEQTAAVGESIYEHGYKVFKSLPKSIQQLYWNTENSLGTGGLKGLAKVQFYNQMAEGLIEATDKKLAQGITSEWYNVERKDKKTGRTYTEKEEVSMDTLKYVLHQLKNNSNMVMEQNDIFTKDLEEYKKMKDLVRNQFLSNKENIFSDLGDTQKELFHNWMVSAMGVIAEARGIESLEKFNTMDYYQQNNKKALENKYFETLEDIITHQDNYAQLVTPNDSEQMLKIEDKINKLLNPDIANRDKGDINYSNLLDPLYMTNERQTYIEAKGNLIGIAAQNNTFHALAQTQQLFIEPVGNAKPEDAKKLGDYQIYLPHATLNVDGVEKTTYSGLLDHIGGYISDKISQYINGAVDAVKDTWLMRLIKDKDLMSTAIFLDRVGVDPEYTFMFINQPIVQDFIRENSIQKSVRGINTDIDYVFENDMIAKMREKYIHDGETAPDPRTDMFKMSDLESTLEKIGKKQELNKEQRMMQVQVLDEYIKYRTMGEHSLKDQMAIMWGNMKSPDAQDITSKNRAVEYAKQFSILQGATKILGNTFQGEIMESMNKSKEAISQITPIENHIALQSIFDIFSNPDIHIKNTDRSEAMGKAVLSLLDYAQQTTTQANGRKLNEYIHPMLIDVEKHVGRLLNENRKGAQGDLLKLLTESLRDMDVWTRGPQDPKNIRLKNKPVTSLEADQLTEAFRELRDNSNTNELYKKLVIVGVLQSGTRDSRTSYNKYIPHEDILKFALPAVDHLMNSDVQGFVNTNAFYRNMWSGKDNKIVPTIKVRTDWMTGQAKSYTQNASLNGYAKKLANELGIDVPEFHLVSSKSNNIKYPVLVNREIGTNPETGRRYNNKEIAEMAQNGDFSYLKVKLFQKVVDDAGNPLEAKRYKSKTGEQLVDYLYKQINAWGDGNNLQEYYSEPRTSVLDKHVKVAEMRDEDVVSLIRNGIVSDEAVQKEVTSDAMKSQQPVVPSNLKEQNKADEWKPKKC